MRPRGILLVVALAFASPALARLDPAACGTHPLKLQEELLLHRQAARKRAGARAATAQPGAIAQDIGNIAILDASGGVLAPRNQFNLDQRTLMFLPASVDAASYRFQLGDAGYDASATSGTLLALGDDDSRPVAIPFDFPFFGAVYRQVFVNSDGNLTFTTGDSAATDRSLGRMAGGAPRISPLFTDLDPSRAGSGGGVHVLADAARLVVSWDRVPIYSGSGTGAQQTFQARLYADGRIEFAYSGISADPAVVGIAPGALRGTGTTLSFLADPSANYPGLVAEVFSNTAALDLEVAAQRFYQTHDDAYDYLVFYNAMGIPAAAGAVAWEETIRNHRGGYGDAQVDAGAEFGSAARLQSVLNMGYLSQYPLDPVGKVATRGPTGDTPVTLLAHETGHLFLAYASIRDPNDAAARPMLGYQNAHWGFTFNSDASVMQGELIRDAGAGVSPEFTTIGTVSGYSPLDLYLMGFIPPEQVEPGYANGMFLVTGAPAFYQTLLPATGVSFDGTRRDVHIEELIQVEGRRTPDYTVSQRRFRFAFVLLVPAGAQPAAADAAQVDTYRTNFERFYEEATGNRAFADTALRHSLHLSVSPAAGVMAGRSATATISVDTPPAAPLVVALGMQTGSASVPASASIAAGATRASFTITGLRVGVEELSATPNDNRYDTAYARIQVAAGSALDVVTVSGDGQKILGSGELEQPIVVRVIDVNRLPYPGVSLQATPSAGGSVAPQTAVTDANGTASFRWSPGMPSAGAVAQLRVAVQGAAAAVVSASVPKVQGAAVLNAATLEPAAAPGMLAIIWGVNLSGGGAPTRLTLGARNLEPVSVSESRIDFYIPPDIPTGAASLVIASGWGTSPPVPVTVTTVAPGIFFDSTTGLAAGLEQPVARGDFIALYCTGLGVEPQQAQVSISGIAAVVSYSGAAPGLLGLNQVNAQVPDAVASGMQAVSITIGGVKSNEVKIGVE